MNHPLSYRTLLAAGFLITPLSCASGQSSVPFDGSAGGTDPSAGQGGDQQTGVPQQGAGGTNRRPGNGAGAAPVSGFPGAGGNGSPGAAMGAGAGVGAGGKAATGPGGMGGSGTAVGAGGSGSTAVGAGGSGNSTVGAGGSGKTTGGGGSGNTTVGAGGSGKTAGGAGSGNTTVGAGGSGNTTVGAGGFGNATQGAGGSGNTTVGAGGSGPPGGCGQVNGTVGCCDGDVNYYCDPSGVLKSGACAPGTCGWNVASSFYDCATTGQADPSGSNPLPCGFSGPGVGGGMTTVGGVGGDPNAGAGGDPNAGAGGDPNAGAGGAGASPGAGGAGAGTPGCSTPDDGSYTSSCDSHTSNDVPSPSGYYYTSDFGCYTRPDGTLYKDPSDNCQPGCGSPTECQGLGGPDCEAQVQWYAADASRFGCFAKIRVTNCDNGKSVILMALDYGPNCHSVEDANGHAVLDMSVPAMKYLFDGQEYGASDHKAVTVEPADASATLGPG